jgi:hypothetical protein
MRGTWHALLCGQVPETDGSGIASALAAGDAAAGDGIARGIRELVRTGDGEPLRKAALALAGRGEGLTPAGDDVLAGVLCALRYCGESGGRPLLSQRGLDSMADACATKTSRFSGFLLRCAARGFVAAPLDDWLWAVHRGDLHGVVSATEAMHALGATSGMAGCWGLGTCMKVLLEEAA